MPTKLNLVLHGTPCGKSCHYSLTDAEAHRSALEAWERAHGRQSLSLGLLSVYWCERCQAYHVGHKVV